MEYEQLRALIARILKIPEQAVAMSSRLCEDLGANSLELYELVTEIEDTFDLTLPEEAAYEAETVADLLAHLTDTIHKETGGGHR